MGRFLSLDQKKLIQETSLRCSAQGCAPLCSSCWETCRLLWSRLWRSWIPAGRAGRDQRLLKNMESVRKKCFSCSGLPWAQNHYALKGYQTLDRKKLKLTHSPAREGHPYHSTALSYWYLSSPFLHLLSLGSCRPPWALYRESSCRLTRLQTPLLGGSVPGLPAWCRTGATSMPRPGSITTSTSPRPTDRGKHKLHILLSFLILFHHSCLFRTLQ